MNLKKRLINEHYFYLAVSEQMNYNSNSEWNYLLKKFNKCALSNEIAFN